MGERQEPTLLQPKFNKAVAIEAAKNDITGDAGAVVGRAAAELLGVRRDLAALHDPRSPVLIKYPLADLLLSRLLFMMQGWHDQDDLDALRDDPAFRVGVNTARGEQVLARTLPSQPTMSRHLEALSSEPNREVLASSLLAIGLRRAREDRAAAQELSIDLDSFPIEVHGDQERSAYNGHYHAACFHPLAAFTDTGDLVGLQLRPGNVHTALDVRPFVEPILDAARARFAKLWVRFDAGFAAGDFFDWLDERRVRFITRLKANSTLANEASVWRDRVVARWQGSRAADATPREETFEFWYQAKSWTRKRRVVAVLVERSSKDGELFENLFFLCTNAARPEASSAALLARYRQRGRAEARIGEFVNEFLPNLSSPCFAANEAHLRLAGIAYEIAHFVRRRIERGTGEGLSLRRLRDRFLRTPARLIRHARRLIFHVGRAFVDAWRTLAHALEDPLAGADAEVAAR
jgi:hypothetical protein